MQGAGTAGNTKWQPLGWVVPVAQATTLGAFRTDVPVTKTLIDLDDDLLVWAKQIPGTTTKKETVTRHLPALRAPE